MAPLHSLGILDILEGYTAGVFTPVDVLQSIFQRIDLWEAGPLPLGGLWHVERDGALRQAQLSAERWRRGTVVGPLDGVPATVKELIATKGVPVPQGSAATLLQPADADSPVAARLKEAGAIIFARTTVPDLGMLSSGVSSFHPLTRNPWNLAANPGGSSAGAAAAGAAGYGPIHIGTDIGGSVRLPAAWCGLIGFKPSLGRIPIDPYYLGRCAGPMSRTVEDAARVMAVLSLPDSRDATSLPYEGIDWAAPARSPAGLRVGVMMDAGCGMGPDHTIVQAIETAARVFEQHGARIIPVGPVLDRELLDGCDLFWRARAWGDVLGMSEERRQRLLPQILDWAKVGAGISGVDAIRGMSGSFTIRRRCAALFDDVDIVLSPVTPVASFPAEWSSPLDDARNRPFEHIAYTLPWNFSEQPAISVNAGYGPGFDGHAMPLGLQIITPRFQDGLAIQIAKWFESISDATVTTWPEPKES